MCVSSLFRLAFLRWEATQLPVLNTRSTLRREWGQLPRASLPSSGKLHGLLERQYDKWMSLPALKREGFKKKSDCILAYEKMTLVLGWFLFFEFMVSFQSLVSSLVPYSMIFVLYIMVPFCFSNKGGYDWSCYLGMYSGSQSDPIKIEA